MVKSYRIERLCMFVAAILFLINGALMGFVIEYAIASLLACITGVLLGISEKLVGCEN